jgi:CheY-like chemotaxis protein
MNNPNPTRQASPFRKILVVDDNLDQVRSLALLLRHRGHVVDYAINGIAALLLLQRFKPDIVLLDLGLPDTHGAELARQIRQNPDLADTKILAITGRSGEAERERALAAGCEWFLQKPLDPKVLDLLIDGNAKASGTERR